MRYKTLSLLFLAATAMAAPEARPEAAPEALPEAVLEFDVEKRQSDYYSNLMDDLDKMRSDVDWNLYLTKTDWVKLATNTHLANLATKTDFGNFHIPTDLGNDISFSMPPVPTLDYLNMPPPSIASVLATALPSSYLSELTNPTARSSIIHGIQQGHYPDWYNNLPKDVKQWVSTNYASMTGPAATATGNSGSSGAGSNGSGDKDGSASAATSHGAAPASTGVIAASIAGAAGILGLALAL